MKEILVIHNQFSTFYLNYNDLMMSKLNACAGGQVNKVDVSNCNAGSFLAILPKDKQDVIIADFLQASLLVVPSCLMAHIVHLTYCHVK